MVVQSPNRVLLDTHALVWYADNSPKLPVSTRQLLDDEHTTLFVSIVTFWELGTLDNLERLRLAPNLGTWIARVRASSFSVLNVEDYHVAAYAKLPSVKDHRDPFDRMLIAQALTEDLTLVSRDGKFGEYAGLKLQWA